MATSKILKIEKKAIKNLIDAFKYPKFYGINPVYSEEQRQAVVKTLENLFEVNRFGEIVDFNTETINAFSALQRLPENPNVNGVV